MHLKAKHYVLYYFLCFSLLGLVSCQSTPEKEAEAEAPKNQAQEIIDKSIKAHGGELYDAVFVSFTFRDKQYTALRDNGLYTYTRSFTDSLGQVKDVLNNDGFYREIDGKKVALPKEKEQAYANSVNSVFYFALLPYGLNDPQVRKEYLGQVTIKGTPYHKVKITFDEEGGGPDFEDEFIYWIHPETYKMGYLAYSFTVNDGGLRFREAVRERNEKGILFFDYNNFEPLSDTTSLEHLDTAFQTGNLKKLSEINLEKLTVTPKQSKI